MRNSVREAFFSFTEPFEGFLDFMYADVKGHITTGLGNLIEVIGPDGQGTGQITSEGLRLRWKRPDGSLASQDEIIAAFQAVDARRDLYHKGGGAFRNVTDLRLDRGEIMSLIERKIEQFERVLRERYPAYDTWPADAQLGLLSMAWAMGPAFNYPAFRAAANKIVPDFATMAEESFIRGLGEITANPLKAGGRNAANYILFMNADSVMRKGGDLDELHFPNFFIKAGIGLGALILASGVGYGAYWYSKKKGLDKYFTKGKRR